MTTLFVGEETKSKFPRLKRHNFLVPRSNVHVIPNAPRKFFVILFQNSYFKRSNLNF